MTTVSMAVAVLLVLPVFAEQQNQVVVELPNSLSVSQAAEGKLATLRHIDASQTFEARARDVSISKSGDRIVVTMTRGEFVWTTSTQPVYKNSFKTLELKFETKGNWIAFRMN